MSPQEIQQFLTEKVGLFEGFAPEKIARIVEDSDLRSYEGKEAIIECGEKGEFIGVLLSGWAEVSVTDNAGERVLIGKLEEGEVFGEMSLLTGDRTVTDIIAGNRCFVLRMPQEVFNRDIVTVPRAVMFLSKLLAERVKATTVDLTSEQLHSSAVSKAADPYMLSLKTHLPGRILVLNVGHTQIRFGLYDTADESREVHGIFDHVEGEDVQLRLDAGGSMTESSRPAFPLEKLFEVIAEETPGVTRDRVEREVTWRGRAFRVVDTGGYRQGAKGIETLVIAQAERAAEQGDVLVADLATVRALHAVAPIRVVTLAPEIEQAILGVRRDEDRLTAMLRSATEETARLRARQAEAYKVLQLRGQKLPAFDGFYLKTLGNARALGLDDRIGRLAPGLEADLVVLDPAATPAMAHRLATIAGDLAETLFLLMTLGDDRAVRATYVMGEKAHAR